LANFLEFPRGELTKDLLAMARNGLRTKLRATCRKAVLEGRTVVETNAKVTRNGQSVRCSITARPLFEPKEAEGLLLVLFHDQNLELEIDASSQTAAGVEQDATTTENPSLTRQLEVELKSMSEELHSTIEEMESSNEELKTSNEEIMSFNEELQSVNEELETSKEELQSLNEELTMVNSQLGEKVSELKQSTEDLMNLMSSTEIATIFLDPQLNIKRFTPPTKSLLNLLATDIGRPLKDIALKFSDGRMLADCQHVLRDQRVREREVHTEEPRYYLRRILPYRTTDDHVTGVVITFIDITQQRESEVLQREKDATHLAEMHESAERIQAILNTAADAIVTVDVNGTIESVNLATESMFQYKRREILGKSLSRLLPTLFVELQHENGSSPTVSDQLTRLVGHRREVLSQRKDGTSFPVELVLSRVDHLGLYTGILRDLTVRKQLQSHILEIATEEQSRIGQELHDGTQQELAGLTLYAGAIQDSLEYATRTSGAAPDTVTWTLSDADFQRIQQTVGKLKQGLIESNQNVHKLSHGIMPVQIDAQGLKSALAELAASTNDQQEIRCHFEFSGSGTITNNAVATQLYRIAQESLNNALKHGKADEIRISLRQDANQIRLEIEDNGTGIDLGAAPRSSSNRSGLGLRIMSYRASILGGELQVLRNAGRRGTTVRCNIPTTGYLT
jgi:two-component system CheB/CheR fusion protein